MVILWICCGYHVVWVGKRLVNGPYTDREWLDSDVRFLWESTFCI